MISRLFSFLFLITVSLNALIIETPHFADILKYVNEETTVILDIDDTLLIPSQMLGCDEWFLHRVEKA